MANPSAILAVALPCLVGIALIALAAVVIRNGGGHRHNVFFAALYILSGIKSMSEGLDQVANRFHADAPLFPPTLFWKLQAGFCALAMLPLLFLFVASFPRPVAWMTRRPALGLLAVLPSAAMGLALVAALSDSAYAPLYLDLVPVFNALGVALTVGALVLLLRTRRGSPDPIERTQARYVAVGFLPAFLAGWVITALQFLADGGAVATATASSATHAIVHFLSPMAELLAAGAIGFAILKYNILGIQPGFRLGVKSFVVGFVFASVFLLTQFVENVILQGQLFGFADSFTGGYGSFILSGVTGLVLFKPIERVSDRVSDRLLPRPTDAAAIDSRAAEIYHAQCVHVLRDARVSERELAGLRNLRGQLGLSEAQARTIEEAVERLLHVDAPETGASPGTAPRHVEQAHADLAQAAVEVVRASPGPPAEPPARAQAPARAAKAKQPAAKTAPAGKAATRRKPSGQPTPRKAAPKAAKKAASKRAKA